MPLFSKASNWQPKTPNSSKKSSAPRFSPATESLASYKLAARAPTLRLPALISPPRTSEKFLPSAIRSENSFSAPLPTKFSSKSASPSNISSLPRRGLIFVDAVSQMKPRKCVDTPKPSCYFSTAQNFTCHIPTEGPHTGTMAFVAKKIFLTKGVGKHRERLSSFELALRNAGIAACNIVRVSSIFPPNCKLISRSEGLKHIRPGQVAFTVISENSTKEPHRLIAASIGLALPVTNPCTGFSSSTPPSAKPKKLPANTPKSWPPKCSPPLSTLNLIRIFPGTRKKRSTASPTRSYAPSTSRNPRSATNAASGPPFSALPSSSAKTTKLASVRTYLQFSCL